MGRAAVVILLVAFAGFPVRAAGQEPMPVGGVSAVSPIASYHGRLVWSRSDGAGRFELVQRVGNGPVTRFAIASRGVPFDVDLGPTSSGRVVAVYSRCTTEPAPAAGLDPEGVRYESGRGCEIYRLDLASGEETRYAKVSASDASEFWPTYWKGRVGFARAYDNKPRSPYVYVKDIERSEPSERLPGGPRGTPATGSAPRQLELYGTRLGFQWRYASTQGTGTVFELRVDTVGGDHIRVDRRVVGLTAIVIGWPAFENGRAYWSRGCFGDPGGCRFGLAELRRGTYKSPLAFERALGPRFVLAHERDSGVTWALADTPAPDATQWCGTTATCSIAPLRPNYGHAG